MTDDLTFEELPPGRYKGTVERVRYSFKAATHIVIAYRLDTPDGEVRHNDDRAATGDTKLRSKSHLRRRGERGMSEIKLSRAQRRQMQKLTDKVDRAAEADRLFLERFPHRQDRVRITSRAEIARQELIDGRPMTIPPGYRWFTAVHNIAPGYRLCLFVRNLEGTETDLEARLRKAARIGT